MRRTAYRRLVRDIRCIRCPNFVSVKVPLTTHVLNDLRWSLSDTVGMKTILSAHEGVLDVDVFEGEREGLSTYSYTKQCLVTAISRVRPGLKVDVIDLLLVLSTLICLRNTVACFWLIPEVWVRSFPVHVMKRFGTQLVSNRHIMYLGLVD
jgi:hypothetical protein